MLEQLQQFSTLNEMMDCCTNSYNLDEPLGAMTKTALNLGLKKALGLDKEVTTQLKDATTVNEYFDVLTDNFDLDEPLTPEGKTEAIKALEKVIKMSRAIPI